MPISDSFKSIFALLLLLLFLGFSNQAIAASETLTAATGGSAISADNATSGTWTTLTGPTLAEGAVGDIGTGTIILTAPSGFVFNTGGTAPTVLLTTGSGTSSRNINGVAVNTAMAITSITSTANTTKETE